MSAAHDDLAEQGLTVRDFVAKPPAPAAAEKHGTAIASLIAADASNGRGMVGIAPDVELLALRACWEAGDERRGRCNTFSLARALNFAIINEADVINLSLAGPEDPILSELVDTALARGIVVIAAEPPEAGMGFPSADSRVITARASGSESTRRCSVPAPGKEVLSAKPDDSYDFFSGSSVAAAQVSGAAALVLSATDDLGIDALSRILLDASGGGATDLDICTAMNLRPERDQTCE